MVPPIVDLTTDIKLPAPPAAAYPPATTAATDSSEEESPLVRALRRRIAELEARVAYLEQQQAQPQQQNKKRAAPAAAAAAGGGAAAEPAAKKPRTPAQRKRLFEKWANALAKQVPKTKIRDDDYHRVPTEVIIKEGKAMFKEEFVELFVKGQRGTRIQPTPSNKPKSATTIYAWDGWDAVKALFGDAAIKKSHGVSYWNFYQGVQKMGEGEGQVVGLEAHYNKDKMSLELHFKVQGMTYRDWTDPRRARMRAAEAYLLCRSMGIRVPRPF